MIFYLIPVALVFGSITMLFAQSRTVINYCNLGKWHKTEGVLTSKESSSFLGKGGISSTVTYNYQVKAKYYTGNKFQMGLFVDDYKKLYLLKVNEPCVVFYDPKNPKQSVLVKSISVGDLIWIGISCVALFFGILLAIICYRSKM